MIGFSWTEDTPTELRDLPRRATKGASGYDLKSIESFDLEPGQFRAVHTGLRLQIPQGLEGQIRARSGNAAKYGIGVLNAPGTIDSDYTGEVRVVLINHGKETFSVALGDRIAQIVFAPVAHPGWIERAPQLTDRGQGGFGSTGR